MGFAAQDSHILQSVLWTKPCIRGFLSCLSFTRVLPDAGEKPHTCLLMVMQPDGPCVLFCNVFALPFRAIACPPLSPSQPSGCPPKPTVLHLILHSVAPDSEPFLPPLVLFWGPETFPACTKLLSADTVSTFLLILLMYPHYPFLSLAYEEVMFLLPIF